MYRAKRASALNGTACALVLAARNSSRLLGLPQALAAIMGVSPSLVYAQSVPQPNTIIPDGRTQTQVSTRGSVTDITTNTISGGNGFNSFSQFREGAGNTVNLHIPTSAGNLINVVRDGPVVINGILNSYKGGQIGGNVYFADSHGFIVGASGVINTGGLTVSTPTGSFLDSIISPAGVVNGAAAA